MRFSILKPILSWQAWKKPHYKRSVRSRYQKRKPRPMLPKASSRRAKRTRRLMKRQPYRNPGKFRSALANRLVQISFAGIILWMMYEVTMASMLLE